MALRAIVKVSGTSTSANQLSNGLTADYSAQSFQSSFAFVNAKGNFAYANIVASSVITDSDSKHQWFEDQFALGENVVLNVTVHKTDTFNFLDSETYVFAKGLTDTSALAETISKAAGKIFTDTPSITDAPSLGFSRPVTSEISNVSDVVALFPVLNKTDGFSHTDTVALSATKGLSDSFSMGSSLARTVAYNLSRSDAFTLDDVFSGMGVGVNKTNVFNFSDTAVFATAKVFSDTQSMAESIALFPNLVNTESLPITDSASVLFIPGSQGMFNAFAFNGTTLNG